MDKLDVFVSSHTGIVLVVVSLVLLLSLLVAITALARIASFRRTFAWVTGKAPESADSLAEMVEAIARNTRDLSLLRESVDRLTSTGRTHLQHVGMVRYDAFDGIAGNQSYSLCLLDSRRNGVLLSTLVGKDFTRSYAVEIVDGEPSRQLGDEEAQALDAASRRATA